MGCDGGYLFILYPSCPSFRPVRPVPPVRRSFDRSARGTPGTTTLIYHSEYNNHHGPSLRQLTYHGRRMPHAVSIRITVPTYLKILSPPGMGAAYCTAPSFFLFLDGCDRRCGVMVLASLQFCIVT